MMGVFHSDYDGGDFCKGLIFGRDGSNMLYEIAQSFVDENEKQLYEIEKKRSNQSKNVEKAKSG